MAEQSAVEIAVHEQACRRCEMCSDICPTKVFEFDGEKQLCVVSHAEKTVAPPHLRRHPLIGGHNPQLPSGVTSSSWAGVADRS